MITGRGPHGANDRPKSPGISPAKNDETFRRRLRELRGDDAAAPGDAPATMRRPASRDTPASRHKPEDPDAADQRVITAPGMERRLSVKTKAFTEADIKREYHEADAADVSSSILVTALPYLGRQHRLLALLVKTFVSVPRNGQNVWINLVSTAAPLYHALARTCKDHLLAKYIGIFPSSTQELPKLPEGAHHCLVFERVPEAVEAMRRWLRHTLATNLTTVLQMHL